MQRKLCAIGVKRAWTRRVWHNLLPPKLVAFLWKLMRYAVPIDTLLRLLQGVGVARYIVLISVIYSSNLILLRRFGNIFGLSFDSLIISTLAHALYTWMSKNGALSHFELCRASVTVLTFWAICVACCAANFEETPMCAQGICQRVINQVQLSSVSFTSRNRVLCFKIISWNHRDQEESHFFKPGRWCQ